jgi:hypothetical protein
MNTLDDHITVSIDEATGTMRFLVNDMSEKFINCDSEIKRASHIEPYNLVPRIWFHILRTLFGEEGRIADWTRTWQCYWRVNLSPVGGPVGTSAIKPRRYAIEAEVKWLAENFL